MTPTHLANTILTAYGSALRHYMPDSQRRILDAAEGLLPHSLDTTQRTAFNLALLGLQKHQAWRLGGDDPMMEPKEVTMCINTAIEGLKVLTGERG